MNSLIIVAGGCGKRMANKMPKQFLLLKGKPILMHTIENFHDFDAKMNIIVVLPEEHHSTWLSLCQQYNFSIKHNIAIGGKERFFSVKNGLKLVPLDTDIIAVHDGVRPFTSYSTFSNCINAAKTYGAAIPTIPLTDSIRKVNSEKTESQSVNRSEFCAVQTPQCFSADLLINAYNTDYNPNFTDDASVVENFMKKLSYKEYEHNNYIIKLVEGNVENIKITTPSDIIIAEYYLNNKK